MPTTSSVHAHTADRPGIARSGAAMLVASGMKRTKDKENSVTGGEPDGSAFASCGAINPALRFACAYARQHPSAYSCSWMKGGGQVWIHDL